MRGGVVEQLEGSPAEIVSKLAAVRAGLYADGGLTIQEFLRAGLYVSSSAVYPCSSEKAFRCSARYRIDIHLSHIATRTYPGGMVQTEYSIAS